MVITMNMNKNFIILVLLLVLLSSSVYGFRSAITAPVFSSSSEQNITELWIQSGSNIYYIGGNVGIGTLDPNTALDVNGIISATGGNSTIWNTAYSWGNHANMGYLTTYTDTLKDLNCMSNQYALYNGSGWICSNKPTDGLDGSDGADGYTPIKGIDYFDGINGTNFDVSGPYLYDNGSNFIFFNDSFLNISNWDEAYSWGDHANNGYVTNETDGIWVKVTGDTMTGNLNMSDRNITDVDTLFVHNISGRSPIYISSEMISSDSITAGTFYGNIQGTNGTIFGVTITNGTIENLVVSDSAVFDTSIFPKLNNTYSLGSIDKMWKQLFIDELVVNNLSSPEIYNLYDLIYSINNSIKEPLGNYLYFNNSNFWINEELLNQTINDISKVRKVTYDFTCITISGTCSFISPFNVTHLITEIKVTPSTLSNNYRFELTQYPDTSQVIDKNRKVHVGIWNIEKNYGIDSQIQGYITNSLIDEQFTISITYLTNGVE